MQILLKIVLLTGVVLGLTSSALAQGAPAPNPATKATLSDPEGPPPNPANVPFVLPRSVRSGRSEPSPMRIWAWRRETPS